MKKGEKWTDEQRQRRAETREKQARKPIRMGDLAYVPLDDSESPEYTVLDWEDVELVVGRNWCISDQGYAHSGSGKTRIKLHRLIRPDLEFVDHINRDRLDNRRSNLRDGSNGVNLWNKGPRGTYKGVTQIKNGSWMARAGNNYIGLYPTSEEAALAYDNHVRALNIEGAYYNFPTNSEKLGV